MIDHILENVLRLATCYKSMTTVLTTIADFYTYKFEAYDKIKAYNEIINKTMK